MQQSKGPEQQIKELGQLILGSGAAFVGFSDVAGKTGYSFKSLHYAITIGIRLSDAIMDEISDKPTFTYFHHYRTVNSLLDQIALRGTSFIQSLGFDAAAVPASQTVNDIGAPYSAIFPHKTAAVLSGLGCIGKNGLFLHNLYGPRVRLATILTDMPVVSSGAEGYTMCPETVCISSGGNGGQTAPSLCLNCDLCVRACPAMALTGKQWHEGIARDEIVDAKACSDYMNIKFKHIGRGSVCGICIKVCPVRCRKQT
jgi:epoxyqueuosine reductase QueG